MIPLVQGRPRGKETFDLVVETGERDTMIDDSDNEEVKVLTPAQVVPERVDVSKNEPIDGVVKCGPSGYVSDQLRTFVMSFHQTTPTATICHSLGQRKVRKGGDARSHGSRKIVWGASSVNNVTSE